MGKGLFMGLFLFFRLHPHPGTEIADARLERYCQNRAISGTPGGRSNTSAIYATISPETGTTEHMRFLAFLGDATAAASVATRLGELGGETVP